MKNRWLLIGIGIIALLIVIVGATLWGTYNSFVTKSQNIDSVRDEKKNA
mgnify:CR=1 FL=1